MGRLIYSALCSVDGYTADADGGFDWAAPSDDVHAALNDVHRGVGTQLLGRRMYEVLKVWETMDVAGSAAMTDFQGLWRGSDKVVYSTTLDAVETPRTRVVREFDAGEVRAMKSAGDLSIGGPHLSAEALRAGIVDDIHLFVSPIVVGGGTAVFPDGVRLDLELAAERPFTDGTVHLHYTPSNPSSPA